MQKNGQHHIKEVSRRVRCCLRFLAGRCDGGGSCANEMLLCRLAVSLERHKKAHLTTDNFHKTTSRAICSLSYLCRFTDQDAFPKRRFYP
jgi:hypothetical protein